MDFVHKFSEFWSFLFGQIVKNAFYESGRSFWINTKVSEKQIFLLLFADVGCKCGNFFSKSCMLLRNIFYVTRANCWGKTFFFSFCSLILALEHKLDVRKKVRINVKIFIYVSRRVFWEKIYFSMLFGLFVPVFWPKTRTLEERLGMVVKIAFHVSRVVS